MRKVLLAAVLIALLTGCESQGQVSGTPPTASLPTASRSETPVPSLDAHSRQLLDQAKSSGRRTVTALILAKPGGAAEAERAVSGLGANVLSIGGPTHSLRAEVPTDAVAELVALPSVAAVQLDEDIKRGEPTP